MSYLSGPDSTVASSVTAKGVGSVGSQLDGPATSRMLPIRTSFAVQGGLPPTFSVMQRLLLDWANAGTAAPIRPPAKQLNVQKKSTVENMRRHADTGASADTGARRRRVLPLMMVSPGCRSSP